MINGPVVCIMNRRKPQCPPRPGQLLAAGFDRLHLISLRSLRLTSCIPMTQMSAAKSLPAVELPDIVKETEARLQHGAMATAPLTSSFQMRAMAVATVFGSKLAEKSHTRAMATKARLAPLPDFRLSVRCSHCNIRHACSIFR